MAFIGLSNRTQMVGGGCRLLPEMLGQNDLAPLKNADFEVTFTHSVSTVTPSKKFNYD